MAETIGLIAGGGRFPFLVAAGARSHGHRVAVAGLSGQTDPAIAGEADAYTVVHLGQLGRLLAFFKREKVTTLVMAGTVNKARAMDFRPDWPCRPALFPAARQGQGRRRAPARGRGRVRGPWLSRRPGRTSWCPSW